MTRNAVTSGQLVPSAAGSCCIMYRKVPTVLYSMTQAHLDAASRLKIMSKSLPWVLEEI